MLLSLFCFVSLPVIQRHFSLFKLSSKFSRPFSFYDSELLTTNAQIPNIEYIKFCKFWVSYHCQFEYVYFTLLPYTSIGSFLIMIPPGSLFLKFFKSYKAALTQKPLFLTSAIWILNPYYIVTPTKVTNSYWITKLEVEKKDIQKEI